MKRTSLLLFMLVFFSCSSRLAKNEVSPIDFSNPSLNEENIQNWIQIDQSLQLALPDSIIIGKVTQVEFTNSEIFLLETGINSSILVFDRSGEFKAQLLKLGTGPGEYSQIEFFVVRENSILIYDRSTQRFIDYGKSDFSQFLEYKAPDYFVGGIGSLAEDGLFLVSDSESDSNPQLYKGYGFFDSDLSNPNYKPQFSGNVEAFLPQSISHIGGNLYLAQPFSDQVFEIGQDTLIRSFQLDFGAKKIPAEASEILIAEEFWAILENGSYYFAAHNLLKLENSTAFNFYNQTIENLNFGLIQNGKAYRFSIDSDLKELFLKPIAVREDLFHTVLLPGEYDKEVIELLNLTEVDYEKPILVSYTIGQ
jgi:hypothetical protein